MISADLGRPLESFIAKLVESGRYNSKSEVLREGVRLVQEREARLAALDASIARGLADAEAGHEATADHLEADVSPDARDAERETAHRAFLLQIVQPGLIGLMDGSVSAASRSIATSSNSGRTAASSSCASRPASSPSSARESSSWAGSSASA